MQCSPVPSQKMLSKLDTARVVRRKAKTKIKDGNNTTTEKQEL